MGLILTLLVDTEISSAKKYLRRRQNTAKTNRSFHIIVGQVKW